MVDETEQLADGQSNRDRYHPSVEDMQRDGAETAAKIRSLEQDSLLLWLEQAYRCHVAIYEYGLEGKCRIGVTNTLGDFAKAIGISYESACKLARMHVFHDKILARCALAREESEIKGKPYNYPAWSTAYGWFIAPTPRKPKQKAADTAPVEETRFKLDGAGIPIIRQVPDIMDDENVSGEEAQRIQHAEIAAKAAKKSFAPVDGGISTNKEKTDSSDLIAKLADAEKALEVERKRVAELEDENKTLKERFGKHLLEAVGVERIWLEGWSMRSDLKVFASDTDIARLHVDDANGDIVGEIFIEYGGYRWYPDDGPIIAAQCQLFDTVEALFAAITGTAPEVVEPVTAESWLRRYNDGEIAPELPAQWKIGQEDIGVVDFFASTPHPSLHVEFLPSGKVKAWYNSEVMAEDLPDESDFLAKDWDFEMQGEWSDIVPAFLSYAERFSAAWLAAGGKPVEPVAADPMAGDATNKEKASGDASEDDDVFTRDCIYVKANDTPFKPGVPFIVGFKWADGHFETPDGYYKMKSAALRKANALAEEHGLPVIDMLTTS